MYYKPAMQLFFLINEIHGCDLYEYSLMCIFLLKILGQLNLIDASENSEVKMFLQKSLKKDPNSRNEMNGSCDDTDSVKVIMSIGIVE